MSAIQQASLRADTLGSGDAHLSNFVRLIDFERLSSSNTEVIYGRNGTGKTHLFRAFNEYCPVAFSDERVFSVYIDCRTLDFKSTGARLSPEILVTVFYKRLIRAFSTKLAEFTRHLDSKGTLEKLLGSAVDLHRRKIASAVATLSQLLDEGEIEKRFKTYKDTKEIDHKRSTGFDVGGKIDLDATELKATGRFGLGGKYKTEGLTKSKVETVLEGLSIIDYEHVRSLVEEIIDNSNARSVILLLDEWSDLPAEGQAILGEMLKKTIGVSNKIFIKIAALKYNCWTSKTLENGQMIGLKPGIDISTMADLDAVLCFDSQSNAVGNFLTILLFKHIVMVDPRLATLAVADFEDALHNDIFADKDAYRELIRSSEGNPRDFLRILKNCSARHGSGNDKGITKSAVVEAAFAHFQLNKEPILLDDEDCSLLFGRIFDKVMKFKSKIFVVSSNLARNDERMRKLWYFRFIHLVQADYTLMTNDELKIYDIYSFDYSKLLSLQVTTGGKSAVEKLINVAATLRGLRIPVISDLSSLVENALKFEPVQRPLRDMFGISGAKKKGVPQGGFDGIEGLVAAGCIIDDLLSETSKTESGPSKVRRALSKKTRRVTGKADA